MCNKQRSTSQTSHKSRAVSCAKSKNFNLPACFLEDYSNLSSEKEHRHSSAQTSKRPPLNKIPKPQGIANSISNKIMA